MLKSVTKPKLGIFFFIIGIILLINALCLIVLVGWGFLKSLQSVEGYIMSGASETSLPTSISQITFDNYFSAFEKLRYGNTYLAEMFGNSIFYAVVGAIVSVAVPCVVAYLTATFDFWFNKVISFVIYFTMVFTVYGSQPSMIVVTNALGLYNTWPGIFIMKASFIGGGYLFYYGTFRSMSKEYAEAAIIDGASNFQVMTQIAFPLASTIIFVQYVSTFITLWNDYQTPMVYLSSYPTASYGLFLFSKATSSYEDYLIYKVAGFMLLLIPTFTVFMCLKKYLLREITEGGVKE